MKHRLFTKALAALSAACALGALTACAGGDDDDAGDVPSYELSALYGYTYGASFKASSSGNQLTPEFTIYDSTHLDWNMSTSTSGMSNNSYYYRSEKTAKNNYTLYWYTSAATFAADDDNRSKVVMTVKVGINSTTSISVMVSAGTEGAGNAMAGKPIDMTRSSDTKKTYSGTDEQEESDDTIVKITVSGDSAEWAKNSSTYTGTLKIHVIQTEDGSSGDGVTPSVTVTRTDGNTATVTAPPLAYGEAMTIAAFDVTGCAVTKDGDVYYLSKGAFDASDGTYDIHGTSLTARLADGVLTMQVVFKPGAMPLDITEVFTSTK